MVGVEVEHTRAIRVVSLSPFTAALCLAGAWLVEGLSLHFEFKTQATDPSAVLMLIALCIALRFPPMLRKRPWLTLPFDLFAVIFIILDFTLILPWQAQAFALPLVDGAVRAFDLSLGFNHVTWMVWLNQHPSITAAFRFIYNSMIPQAVLIISLCLATGRIRHLDRYLCAFALAIILTSAISILMPTHGIVADLDPTLRTTPAWPFAATDVATYDALRSGTLRDLIGVPKLGIVSFPSFHAASAVLAAWAFWTWPPTRYPAAALNVIVSIATVGCGGHYIADVLVGILVAVCSIILAVRGSDLGYIFLDRAARLFRKVALGSSGTPETA
ncbi:phosphatase PAP2 family protein [Methylobacterium oryzae]|uniref:phosphatase PAP2 family protein n=1 Tax=Methylobacterium oryzae TaxID=334852 RepID=UPI001F375245|nr:phosphatase PAP2 family protein [Methylobacterium oryzae]UIN38430.1 phosphatase PAP2 family protein [Methylobacterium oryzae]